MSPTKQKILLLLLAGVGLGFSYTPNQQYRIIKALGREWQQINRKKLRDDIRDLYKSQLVEVKEHPDGSLTYVLSDRGKSKALTYHFQHLRIKKSEWDGKWRMVIFDIPEKLRKSRDALREKLKELGFYELQKSVLVFPYECRNEIEFLIEFFGLKRFVRFGTLDSIDNDLHLREIFHLL